MIMMISSCPVLRLLTLHTHPHLAKRNRLIQLLYHADLIEKIAMLLNDSVTLPKNLVSIMTCIPNYIWLMYLHITLRRLHKLVEKRQCQNSFAYWMQILLGVLLINQKMEFLLEVSWCIILNLLEMVQWSLQCSISCSMVYTRIWAGLWGDIFTNF